VSYIIVTIDQIAGKSKDHTMLSQKLF